MDVKNNLRILLDEACTELKIVSEKGAWLDAFIETDQGTEMITLAAVMEPENASFRMYSSSSPASLRAYVKGFTHALRLVNGDYSFKPNNESAARRKRESICPWKEDAKKYRLQQTASSITGITAAASYINEANKLERHMKMLANPRFKPWRTRFRGD